MLNWPAESPADAPAYRADIVLWTSVPLTWWAWGERRFNLCALGSPDINAIEAASGAASELGRLTYSVDQVLDDIVSLEFRDEAEFNDFGRRFRRAISRSEL